MTTKPRSFTVPRDLLADAPDRRAAAPVGSDAWLRLPGEGGTEDYGEASS